MLTDNLVYQHQISPWQWVMLRLSTMKGFLTLTSQQQARNVAKEATLASFATYYALRCCIND
jgi:hypothetical protein